MRLCTRHRVSDAQVFPREHVVMRVEVIQDLLPDFRVGLDTDQARAESIDRSIEKPASALGSVSSMSMLRKSIFAMRCASSNCSSVVIGTCFASIDAPLRSANERSAAVLLLLLCCGT